MVKESGLYDKLMAGRKTVAKETRKDWVRIGAIIRELRESLGLSQEEMAEKLGISQNALSRYERGEHFPDKILPLIEKALNIPEAYIKARAGVYSYGDLLSALKAIKNEPVLYDVDEVLERELYIIPVITRVGAGGAILTENYVLYDGRVPRQVRAFIVEGDSMEPTIYRGATVLINVEDKEPVEGKIYLFARASEGDSSSLLLRRLKRIENEWYMLPDNPAYPAKPLTSEWTIVGRAVEIVKIERVKL